MTQIADSKKRRYSLRMKDTYNEFLQHCKTGKRVKELKVILNKPSNHIINYVKSLAVNGHVERVVIDEKTGLIEILALSDFVPDDEFADEYKPRSRSTTPMETSIYTWVGNPYRETVI